VRVLRGTGHQEEEEEGKVKRIIAGIAIILLVAAAKGPAAAGVTGVILAGVLVMSFAVTARSRGAYGKSSLVGRYEKDKDDNGQLHRRGTQFPGCRRKHGKYEDCEGWGCSPDKPASRKKRYAEIEKRDRHRRMYGN
jgi:hypothetical protein